MKLFCTVEGYLKFSYQKGNTAIYISIAIALILILIVPGVALGTAFAYINNHTGAMSPSGSSGISGQCFMPDQYWTNGSTTELPNAQAVLDKLGDRAVKPSKEDIDLILTKVRAAGVNPAITLATWGKEQGYGNRDNAFGVKLTSGFESELRYHINTLTDAKDNTGNYANRPVNTAIQVWWRSKYTPSSEAGNENDVNNFFSFLRQLVPNQITCAEITETMDFRSIGPGFNGQVGLWKNIDEVFASLGGNDKQNIQKQIVSTKFMGVRVSVNTKIIQPLQKVESDIKASGTNYQIRQSDTGGFVWRQNVNNPSAISPHSTGLAVDVNWRSNPNSKREATCQPRDPNCCKHDISKAVSDAFEKNGFFWGAKFMNVCDAMHFQYGGNWN